jgi:DNA-binding MarR family transcriptional regulator
MKSKEFNEADVNDLKLSLGLLVRRLRATTTAEQQDLSWTQKSVILRLEEDGPMTAADLARAESVKPQSMGTAIAQLEEKGLIEKKPRKDDGRQIDIKVTAKALAMRKTNHEASRSWLSEAISKLSRADQVKLFEAGQIIKKLVKI